MTHRRKYGDSCVPDCNDERGVCSCSIRINKVGTVGGDNQAHYEGAADIKYKKSDIDMSDSLRNVSMRILCLSRSNLRLIPRA